MELKYDLQKLPLGEVQPAIGAVYIRLLFSMKYSAIIEPYF